MIEVETVFSRYIISKERCGIETELRPPPSAVGPTPPTPTAIKTRAGWLHPNRTCRSRFSSGVISACSMLYHPLPAVSSLGALVLSSSCCCRLRGRIAVVSHVHHAHKTRAHVMKITISPLCQLRWPSAAYVCTRLEYTPEHTVNVTTTTPHIGGKGPGEIGCSKHTKTRIHTQLLDFMSAKKQKGREGHRKIHLRCQSKLTMARSRPLYRALPAMSLAALPPSTTPFDTEAYGKGGHACRAATSRGRDVKTSGKLGGGRNEKQATYRRKALEGSLFPHNIA